MRRVIISVAAAATLGVWLSASGIRGQFPVTAPRCLHDEDETQANRLRRERALTLARAINTAQGQVVQRTGRYQQLTALGSLPSAPDGFEVRLYTDGAGYLLSVKDSRDSCRYGIFSDQNGFVYQMTPTAPLVAS